MRAAALPQGAGAAFAANGAFSDNLEFADREKDRSFIESITSGKFHNQAEAGVESALSAMLGRMAGQRGREVTWEEQLRARGAVRDEYRYAAVWVKSSG